MNEARRRKVLKVMAVILLAFGGSLIYFLFFNSGLEILPDPSNQSGRVIITNQSVHAIRHISVSYLVQGSKVGEEVIPVLQPGEEYVFTLNAQYVDNGKYVIHASAPYHLSRQLALQASPNSSLPDVSFSFEFPSIATQNQPVSVEVTGCNEETHGMILEAQLELADPSSGINPPPKSWGLPPKGCGSTPLTFTPLIASETLSFKIKVFAPSLMLLERVFSIEVLSVSGADVNAPIDQNAFPPVISDSNSSVLDQNVLDANTFDENGGL